MKNRRLCLLLVAAISSASTILACRPQMPSLFPSRLTLAVPHQVEMDTSLGVPIVEVEINGQGPFRLVFDTGAFALVLDLAVAERLKLPRAAFTMTGMARSVGGLAPAYYSRVETLRIGTLTRGGMDAMVVSLSDNMGGLRVDGLLGLPAFYDLVTTVDYAAGTIRFASEPRLREGESGTLAIAQQYGISLYVQGSFEGERVTVQLDTGASFPLFAQPRLLEILATPPFLVPYTIARSPTGSAPIKVTRLDGDLRLGSHVFRNPIAAFVAKPVVWSSRRDYASLLDPDLTLGQTFLSQFELVIDPESKLVRLTRPDSRPIESDPIRILMLGVDLAWREGGLYATAPSRGPTPGAALQPGDRIVSISGIPAEAFSYERLNDYADREPVELEIEREGRRLQIAAPVVTLVE